MYWNATARTYLDICGPSQLDGDEKSQDKDLDNESAVASYRGGANGEHWSG
jgi:hypothetical protein